MFAANTTLATINRRNRDYWDNARTQLFRRLADEAVRDVALEILAPSRGLRNKCFLQREPYGFSENFALGFLMSGAAARPLG
jgi:hypothetical protein